MTVKNLLIACLVVALLIKVLPTSADDTVTVLGHGHKQTWIFNGPGTETAQPDAYITTNYEPVSGISWVEFHGGNLDDHAEGWITKFIAEREAAIRVEGYTSDRLVQGRPYSILACTSARGTEAAPLGLLTGDDICTISFDANWGTGSGEGARISAEATENTINANHRGTSLAVWTTENGGPIAKTWRFRETGTLEAQGPRSIVTTRGVLTLAPAGNLLVPAGRHVGIGTTTPGYLAWAGYQNILTVENPNGPAAIEFRGNISGADANVGCFSFENAAATIERSKRIAELCGQRTGDDNAGRLTMTTWDANGVPVSIDLLQTIQTLTARVAALEARQ